MTTIFYRDPRLLALTIILIVVFGIASFLISPRMEDPTLTQRVGIVNTRVPGANADRVEALVTEELVERLRSVEEVKEVRSTSRANISVVTVVLKDEVTAVDEVWSRVRDKLSDARPALPTNALAPDLDVIQVRAFSYITALRWNSDDQPNLSILRRLSRELQDELRSVAGTEEVEMFGAPEEEIVIEVSPDDLNAVGLSVASLNRQIANSDPKIPSGQVRSAGSDLLIEMGNKLDSVDRVGSIVVRSGETGATLLLSDIARIEKAAVNPPRSLSIVDGDRAIMVAASIDSSTRIDYWTERVEQRLESFKSRLPRTLTMDTIFRQNDIVEGRINSLMWNLIISALTVVLVVFFMMGWRSAWIVGLTLPFASLMVFTGLQFMGTPLHQMSLSALVIALGMLEGTAIIIVDEVQRRIRSGATPIQALSDGVSHMALPLFGSTITTVLSFAPIATMPGPSGEFVGSIGSSVILALCCSLALSLTIIPTLSALFTSSKPLEPSFLNQGFSNRQLSRIYRSTLRFAFQRPLLGVLGGVAVCLPGFAVIPLLSEQFFPAADRGMFHIEIELSAQASIQQTEKVARQVRELLLQHEEVERVDISVGESIPSFYYNVISTLKDNSRFAEALVQLNTSGNATEQIREFQQELDEKIPEALIRVRQLEQGPPFNAPIEARWFGSDPEQLRELGNATRQLLATHPDVLHSQSDLTDTVSKVVINLDEAAISRAGFDMNSIARQLDATLEGTLGGLVLEGNEELPTRLRLTKGSRNDLAGIESLEVRRESAMSSEPGTPITSLGTTVLKPEVASISKFDGRTMNEVRGYITAGVLPSKVLKWFKQQLKEGKLSIPPGYTLEMGGEDSKRNEAIGQLSASIGMIAAGMVFVLVFSLKSFRASLIILAVGGLSVGFGMLGLWAAGFPLGFTAIVGAMGMIGVAINDSIVVLADLRSDERSAAGDIESVLDIVMRSTRHVLSTTFTVAVGFIPLVLEGGTFWPPMAMVISAGVIGATILALYSVPAVHLLIVGRKKTVTVQDELISPTANADSAVANVQPV